VNGPSQKLRHALEKSYLNMNGIYVDSMPLEQEIGRYSDEYSRGINNDPRNTVGLTLLELENDEIGIHYGWGWDSMSVAAARKCSAVVDVNANYELLELKKLILQKEGLENHFLLNCDLKKELKLDCLFDFAIINGCLKMIPLGATAQGPQKVQFGFLQRVCKSLKISGRLYLAAGNRYDYHCFIWKKKPYWNYLHSLSVLETLLKKAGFAHIENYASFPDFQCPRKIIPLKRIETCSYMPVYNVLLNGHLLIKLFRRIRIYLDILVFKKLKLYFFAPDYIFVARKDHT
jgi:SAM-dependent methyltransferase